MGTIAVGMGALGTGAVGMGAVGTGAVGTGAVGMGAEQCHFVVCFWTTYFLLGTAHDYLFRSLFLDYIFFCWARQVIICFVVCFRTT